MYIDADSIRSIAAGGETLTTEFTSDRSRLNDRTLVEAVTRMANGQGGTVLVGVEDDGTITGSRPRHGTSTDPALMQALIANLTVPPLSTTVDVVDVDGSAVIAVRVDRSTTPVGTRHGVYTRRALRQDGTPECVPYAFHECPTRSTRCSPAPRTPGRSTVPDRPAGRPARISTRVSSSGSVRWLAAPVAMRTSCRSTTVRPPGRSA
ncbi:putative transcriptional regulator [Cellulomonas flavigena DSM 20109]|uniref:Putative transcriptional regulator n=1 Tax=Cellulomonas flavigena (strain ATCC 482 / DSM 20109 / BCRC 11376 / JCM 18109 / NBRC 3775 / NCIMB 8073 / NRS 134) TaxID=446466 RepID=D5UC33_CELFN|nr:ATP-binding protein [Cellulomonas flavigena]ADG76192.1 putative transcriptional regulator [Cellulomonas flavigena DSM 20109]